MNLIRCKEGHFYDKEKNPVCPICNSLEVTDVEDRFSTTFSEDACIFVPEQQMVKPQAVHADIYRSSVILKLRAQVQLKEGENLIYILGDRISSDIRLKFTDNVDAVRILGEVTVTASKKDDKGELEKLADEGNRLIDKRNILVQEAEQLSNLLNFSALQNISMKDAMDYVIEIQPEKIQKVYDELHKIQKELEQICKKIKEFEKEKKKEQHAALCVMVNSNTEGKIPFEIMYEERTAGWVPRYEIHMDDETKPLRFRLRAIITRAGVCSEWKDISVRLFGETTRQYNEIPVLTPKHLKYMEEKKEKQRVIEVGNSFGGGMPPLPVPSVPAPPMSAALPSMGYGESLPLEDQQTTLSLDGSVFEEKAYDTDMNSDITTRFELSGKWTFPEVTNEDQRFREMTIDIQDFTLPGVYRYYAVPGGSTNVYLTAKFEETDMEQILACHADLYVKNVMIGSCMLRPKAAAHQYRISLGKDDELYAARKQTQNQHYANKQRKTKKDVYEYRITLQNRKSQDVVIQVVDQIPISDDSRIEVIQEELSGGIYNEENGEVTWSVNVEAKSSKDLILRYGVIYNK